MTARDLHPAGQGAVGASGPPPVAGRRRTRLHPAWIVAGVSFVALIGAAGFRSAPGVLMVPDAGRVRLVAHACCRSRSGVNLILYGLTAPFAAALMDRFGIRVVTSTALVLVALGSGLTVFVTAGWQLVLSWGVLIGLGTGSMALVFAATIANRWFVRRRGLVMGVLTAASATGQLIFLPLMAWLAEQYGWRAASLMISCAALAVVPLVLRFVRNYPADLGASLPLRGAGPRQPRHQHGSPISRRLRTEARSRASTARAADAGLRRDRRARGTSARRRRRRDDRRGRRRAARRRPADRLVTAPDRGPDPNVLGAGDRLRDLRGDDERPDRHPFRTGRARPRHADHHRGRPARRGRDLRHRRHDRLRRAHRPVQPAAAAGLLLHVPRRRAADAAGSAVRLGAPEHAGVRHRLRPRLGGDGAADRGALRGRVRRQRGRSCSAGCSPRTDRRGAGLGRAPATSAT